MTVGTAVIVGVGPGLGVALALARTFADAGHPVALLARDATRLDSYVAELHTPERAARGYNADAAQPAQLRTSIRAAVDDLGAPEVLVYNAAVLRPDSPTEATTTAGPTRSRSTSSVPRCPPRPFTQRYGTAAAALLFTGGGLALEPSAQYASLSVWQGRTPRLRASPPRRVCWHRCARHQRHDHRSHRRRRRTPRPGRPGPGLSRPSPPAPADWQHELFTT